MVSRSLLTESILASSDTILTSPGIQKRYQEAVKSLKREIYVDEESWLLSEEKTASFIKVTKKYNKSEKNEDKSKIYSDKSEKNTTKEIKLNIIIYINIYYYILCKAEALALLYFN